MSALVTTVLALDDDQVARLRRHGFACGAVIERDGLGLYGFGAAEVIPLGEGLGAPGAGRAVIEHLARLAGPSGPQPVALGALPFLADAPAHLVVPRVLVEHGPDRAHAVVVGPPGEAALLLADLLSESAESKAAAPPDRFHLVSVRPHSDFIDLVAHAVGEVRAGHLDKVVVAREVEIEANRPLRQADLLERLRSLHPSCVTFALEGFLGATPELLIRREGDLVASDPLAGTAARSGDPEADRRIEQALWSSEKERAEHRAVVDAIAAGLGPLARELDVPAAPEILELRNVSHLRTPIRGRLAPRPEGLPDVLELVAAIHPTPAVAGWPVAPALEYLAKHEHLDRGRYAGPVGFVRANGDGEFHLGIRSAVVEGARARLFAGVGVVADSDPAAELAESQLKLQAVLAAAVRP